MKMVKTTFYKFFRCLRSSGLLWVLKGTLIRRIPSNWVIPPSICRKHLTELSLWNKIKYLNLNIFRTRWCKPLIFQTQIIWSNRIHSLKYLRSATFGSKDIVIRKSEFVAKTQLLWHSFISFSRDRKIR